MGGKRPRIAIDAREMKDWATGIGNYVHNLAERLPVLDPHIDFYFLRNGQPPPHIEGHGPNAQFVVSPEYSEDRWEKEFVPWFLEAHDIDLYHSTRNGFLAFWPPGRPYLVTVHDLVPLMFPDRYAREWIRRIEERAPSFLSGAEMIITDSHSAGQDVQRLSRADAGKFRVIYLGVSDAYGPVPETEARATLKERFGLDGNYVFYVGGFSFRKNVRGLIRAYSLLPEWMRRTHRLVLGGYRADDFDGAVGYACELGLGPSVVFTGPARCSEHDLRCLYGMASLFVYPSIYEGFGLPPIEAMACGAPVIVSNRGSLPEVSGEGALVVDPEDHHKLAEAMFLVLTDPELRRSLVARGLAVARRFSWDRTARETLEAYKAVLRRTRQDRGAGVEKLGVCVPGG